VNRAVFTACESLALLATFGWHRGSARPAATPIDEADGTMLINGA